MALRKNPLVVEAAAGAGVPKVVADRIVTILLEGIVREVAGGGEVRLGNFGFFDVADVPSHSRRGWTLRRGIRFRPGKRFRDAVRP